MAYNNRYYDSPASPTSSPQFATNPTRTKSQKWTTAPKVDYGGDDWGEEDDIYDDNSGRSKQGYGGPPMPSIPAQYLQTRPGGGIERSMTVPLETQGQASAPAPTLQRQGTMPLGGGQILGSGLGSYGSVPIVRKPSKADRERQALDTAEQWQQQQQPVQETPRQSVEFREDYQAENLPAQRNVIPKSSSVPTTPPRIRRPAEIYASAHNSPVDTRPRTSESNKSLRQPPAIINNEVPDVPSSQDGDDVGNKETKQDAFGGALPKSASFSPPLNASAKVETSERPLTLDDKVDSVNETQFAPSPPTATAPQASDLGSGITGIPSNQNGSTDSASLAPESAHDAADSGLSRSSTTNSRNNETMSFAKMVSHAFSRKPQDSEDTTPQSGIEPPEETTGSGIDTSVSPILPRVSRELENIAQERAVENPGVDSEKHVQEGGYPGSGSPSRLPSAAASPSPPSTSAFDKRASLEDSNRTSASHPSVALLKDEGQRLQWRSSSPTHGDRRSQSPVIVIPKEDNANHFEAEKSVEWGVATPISIHKLKEISPIDTHMPIKDMENAAIEETQVDVAKEAGTSPANTSNKSTSFAAFLGQKSPQSSSAVRSTSPALSFKDFMGQRAVSPQRPSSSTPPNNAQISDSSATTPTIGATPRFKDFLLQKASTNVAGQGPGLGIQGPETNRGASPTHLTEVSQAEKPRDEPPRLDTTTSSAGSNDESEQLTKQIFSQLHYDSPTAPSPQSPVKQDITSNSKLGVASTLKQHTAEDEPIRPLSTSPRQVGHMVQPPPSQVAMPSAGSAQNNRVSVSPVTPQDGKRVSDQIRQLHLHQPVPNPITRSIPPGSRFATQKSGGDDDYEPSIVDYQASTTSDFVPSPVETLQPTFPDTGKDYPEVPIILELRNILALSDAQDRIRCADKARELFASDHEGFRYRLQLWTQYVHSMDDRHPGLWGSAGRARKMHKPRINPLLGPDAANNQYSQDYGTDGDKYEGWDSLDDNPRGSRPSTGLAEGQARLAASQQQTGNSGIVPQPQQQQQQQQLHPGSVQLGGIQNSQQQQQLYQQQQQQPIENQRLAEFGQPQGAQPPSQAAQFTHFQQEHEKPQLQPSEGHTKLKDKVSAVKVGKNLKALFSKKKDKDAPDHGGTKHQTSEHIPNSSQSQVPSSGRFGGFRAVSDFPQSRKEQSTLTPVEPPSQQRSASYQGVGAGLSQPVQYQPGAAPTAGAAQPQQPTWHRQAQGPSPQAPQTLHTSEGIYHAGAPKGLQEPVNASQESAHSLSGASATQSAPLARNSDDTPPPLRRKSNSKPLPAKRGVSGVSPSPAPSQKPLPPISGMGQQQQPISQLATQYPPSSFTNPFPQQQQQAQQLQQQQPQQQQQQQQPLHAGQAPHDNAPPHPPSTGYEPSFSNASIASYERPKKRHSFFGSLGGQSSQGDLHQQQQGQGEGDHVKSGKRSSSSFFGQLKSQLPGSKHQHTASETTGLGGSSGEKKKVGGLAFLKDLGTMDAFGKTEASKRKEESRPQGAQNQLQPSPGQQKPANISDPYVAKIYDSYTGTYMTYDEIVARDKALEAGVSPPARPTSRQVSSPAGIFAAAQQASYGQPQSYVIPRTESHVTPRQQPLQLQQPIKETIGNAQQSQGVASPANQPPNSQYVEPSHNHGSVPSQHEQQQWNSQAPTPQPGQIQRTSSWNINQAHQQAPSIASVTSSAANKPPGQSHLNPIDDDSTPPPLKKFSPSPSPPPRRAAAAGAPPPVKTNQQGLIRKISSPPPPSARFRAIPSSPPPIRQRHVPSSPHSQSGGFTVMNYPSSVIPQPSRSPVRGTHSPSNASASGYASPVPQPGGVRSVGTVTPTVSETTALDSPRAHDREATKSPNIAPDPQNRSITPASAAETSKANITSSPSSKPTSPAPADVIMTDETVLSEKGKEKAPDSEGENKIETADSPKDDESKQKINENNVPMTNDNASHSGKDAEPKKVLQNFDFDEKIAVDPEGPVPEPPKDDSDDEKLVMSATSGPGSAWEFY